MRLQTVCWARLTSSICLTGQVSARKVQFTTTYSKAIQQRMLDGGKLHNSQLHVALNGAQAGQRHWTLPARQVL